MAKYLPNNCRKFAKILPRTYRKSAEKSNDRNWDLRVANAKDLRFCK